MAPSRPRRGLRLCGPFSKHGRPAGRRSRRRLGGSAHAAYKRQQPFIQHVDAREVLLRLFAEQSSLVLGDPLPIAHLLIGNHQPGSHLTQPLSLPGLRAGEGDPRRACGGPGSGVQLSGVVQVSGGRGNSLCHPPESGQLPSKFTNPEGRPIALRIWLGEPVVWIGVFYQGGVEVNLAGSWRQTLEEPLWVITDMEPEKGQRPMVSE